jgi:hypothetical protein
MGFEEDGRPIYGGRGLRHSREHIEAKKTARQFYDPQTPFQPDEHALPLGVEDVRELDQACRTIGPKPRSDIHDDFLVEPLWGTFMPPPQSADA